MGLMTGEVVTAGEVLLMVILPAVMVGLMAMMEATRIQIPVVKAVVWISLRFQ